MTARRVRQGHRWLSIAFTVTVVAAFVATILPESAAWLFYVPLLPLALLLATGLYLFALPYARRQRAGRGAAGGR